MRIGELGFGQNEVRRLTDLAHQRQPACAKVHELLEEHVSDVRRRVRELERVPRHR